MYLKMNYRINRVKHLLCLSIILIWVVLVVSKKSKKKSKKKYFLFVFLLFLIGKNRHGIGKKVAIFEWEWGRNSALREGQKFP